MNGNFLSFAGLLLIVLALWPTCPPPPVPVALFQASLQPGETFTFKATEASEVSQVTCGAPASAPEPKASAAEPLIALLPNDPSFSAPDAPALPPASSLLPPYGLLLPQPPYSPPVVVPVALPASSSLWSFGAGLVALWSVMRRRRSPKCVQPRRDPWTKQL